MIESGLNYREVARRMGMRAHSTVRRWHLDYMKDGVAGLQYRKGIKVSTSVETSTPMKKKLSSSEREELLSLRKRNKDLELQVDYLKKLRALAAKKRKKSAKAKKQK